AIMVDMAPASSAPQPTQEDLAPGPVMQQADASPPEPAVAEAVQEQIAPTPPQEKPEVVAPPEQKVEMKPVTEPAKPVPDAKPTPVKPKVVRADAKKPTDAPPAPRTTASPRAERQAPAASASAGAFAAFQTVSARRQVRRPAGNFARQLYAQPKRRGALCQPRRLVRPFATGRRDAGDGTPRTAVSRVSR